MEFVLNEKTLAAIKEDTGALFLKVTECVSWAGTSISLWSGVSNPKKENLSRFNEYEHQGIKIYIEKKLKTQDTIHIDVNPKFLFFKPSFSVRGVEVPSHQTF